jgi:hypothetical protein
LECRNPSRAFIASLRRCARFTALFLREILGVRHVYYVCVAGMSSIRQLPLEGYDRRVSHTTYRLCAFQTATIQAPRWPWLNLSPRHGWFPPHCPRASDQLLAGDFLVSRRNASMIMSPQRSICSHFRTSTNLTTRPCSPTTPITQLVAPLGTSFLQLTTPHYKIRKQKSSGRVLE